MIPTIENDGEGGRHTTWTDGAQFTCYQAFNSSMEARRAEQQGVTSLFDFLIDKDAELSYDDYFRDDSTGQTYRVTSVPDDKATPPSASFSLKFYTAERKELPT